MGHRYCFIAIANIFVVVFIPSAFLGKDGYYPVITGECTPRTAWAAGAHHAIQGPGGLPSMNVSDHHQLTPYRIAHVLPHLKIIVIMRNPIERLVNL